ncbi:NAD(P)H-dependent oxidoreductase [Levilactobacillus cerevisiae]|uniref:NAD(P)H-dependent oxidoreductase n=1 Tax=Levilactobacillus cerevisiae TaxID=1704076 RepID=UPI000F7A9C7C|nr:NAD(P)H-dependent oxidoreductase [Levilactobacillus cerevisiae]
MKTVIIFDHPYTATAGNNVPHHRSFLAALLQRVMTQQRQAHNDVDLIDLHADGFNPVMSAEDLSNWRRGRATDPQVADYQQRLFNADRIIFMFPVWWEVMPAMTKGFLDKVYAKGQLYDAQTMKTKLTKQPRIDIITTMGTPNLAYRLLFGAPLAKLLFRGTFLKTRLWHFKWHNFAQVEKKSLQQREQLLQKFSV